MRIEADEDADGVASLPATMADIFLALVAVVVIMLLALAPAIRQPGALASSRPADISRANLVIDGVHPRIFTAERDGLRVADEDARLVPISGLHDDAPLTESLTSARARGENILLVIEPDGQEAAFLFDSLAGSLGIGDLYLVRIDEDCGYIADPALMACRAKGAAF